MDAAASSAKGPIHRGELAATITTGRSDGVGRHNVGVCMLTTTSGPPAPVRAGARDVGCPGDDHIPSVSIGLGAT